MKRARRVSRVLCPGWNPSAADEDPTKSDWIEVDVDEYWVKVDKMDLESELIHKLSNRHFWNVTLPHMGLPDDKQKAFIKTFFTSSACKKRKTAIYGVVPSRRIWMETLVRAAKSYLRRDFPNLTKEDSDQLDTLYVDEDGREWDYKRIGQEFVSLVEGGDKKTFQALTSVATNAPDSQGDAKDKPRSKAWRGFCRFVQKNQRLPIISEFQEAVGLSFSANDQSSGSKYRKELGLRLQISLK